MTSYFNPLKRELVDVAAEDAPRKRQKTRLAADPRADARAKLILEKLVGIDIERKKAERAVDSRDVLRAIQRADTWRTEDGGVREHNGMLWEIPTQGAIERSITTEAGQHTIKTIWIKTNLSTYIDPSGGGVSHVPEMTGRFLINDEHLQLVSASVRLHGVHTDAYMCTEHVTILADSTVLNFDRSQSTVMDALLRVSKPGAIYYQRPVFPTHFTPSKRLQNNHRQMPFSAYTVALPYGEKFAFNALRAFFDAQRLEAPVSDDYISTIIGAFKAIRFAAPVALGETIVPAERVPGVVRRACARKLARTVSATIAYNRWRRFTMARVYSPERLRKQGVFDEI